MSREQVLRYMEERGGETRKYVSDVDLIRSAYKFLRLGSLPKKPLNTKARINSRFRVLARAIRKKCAREEKKKRIYARCNLRIVSDTTEDINPNALYASYEWRQLRYRVLEKYGARCQCCGSTSADGVVINVDHIKPVREHWHLRLDFDNLQVLCEVCNHGKGNWDSTDWRPSMKGQQHE